MPWRSTVAALAAAMTMFLLSGLWNTFIIAGFLADAINPDLLRAPPRLWMIFLGYLWLGAAMAFLFPRFAPEVPKARRTVTFAVFVALIWVGPYSFVLHGVYRFPWEGLFLDPVWALIEQGAGAWVVSAVLWRGHKT